MNFSGRALFLWTFLVAFGVHYAMMNSAPIVDQEIWVRGADYLYHHNPQLLTEPTYGYPGTSLLEGAYIGRVLFSLSPKQALFFSIAALDALAIAGIAVVCRLLQPNSLWWFVAAGMMTCSRFTALATPPSIVVSFVVPLIFLLAWYAVSTQIRSKRMAFLVGAVLGVSFATRFDISIAASGMLFVFLWRNQYRWSFFLYGLLGVAASFFVLDPYLWFMPVRHITDMIYKIFFFYDSSTFPQDNIPLGFLIFRDPFATAGVVLMVTLLWFKTYFDTVERRVVETILLLSAAVITVITHAKYQTVWYFFPLMNLWIIFLARFVMNMPMVISLPAVFGSGAQQRVANLMPWVFVSLLVGGSAFTLVHLYSIPTGVFVLPLSR